MKKIMFNDKYGLTGAVLKGYKTQTRRLIKPSILTDNSKAYAVLMAYEGYDISRCKGVFQKIYVNKNNHYELAYISDDFAQKISPYKIGEEIAIAQSYEDLANSHYCTEIGMMDTSSTFKKEFCGAGWKNKMFVKSEYMPNRIKITNIRAERLQDISDEDCMKEGIMEGEFMNTWDRFYYDEWGDVPNHITFKTPREAYASLIGKISGKGTWEKNPWVFVYDFELVK